MCPLDRYMLVHSTYFIFRFVVCDKLYLHKSQVTSHFAYPYWGKDVHILGLHTQFFFSGSHAYPYWWIAFHIRSINRFCATLHSVNSVQFAHKIAWIVWRHARFNIVPAITVISLAYLNLPICLYRK